MFKMFNMREFVKSGFLKAVGKMADYQIILNAAGWNEKGVLNEDDLAEINAAINAKNVPSESDAADNPEETEEQAV